MTLIFLSTYRRVQRAGRNYTQARALLEFNATVALDQIPPPEDIESTVVQALSDNDTASNVTFFGESVRVTGTELAALERSSALSRPVVIEIS